MGLYDNVDYKDNCGKCGEPLSDFQTKDGDCGLETVQPENVRHFYTFCNHCDIWHDYYIIVEKYRVERLVRLKSKNEGQTDIEPMI